MKALLVLVCLVLIGCQSALSDEDIDRIAERVSQNPVLLDEQTVDLMVGSMLTHPTYLASEDDRVVAMTNAMLEHPSYQTTLEEECVATILMATVISGEYATPSDSEVKNLCEWYIVQTEAIAEPE